MKFGRVAVAASQGLILAHSVKGPGVALRKGEVVGPAHISALERAGITSIIGAKLEPGDVAENEAALRLATHIAASHIHLDRAFTGRCNLLAGAAGLVGINVEAIHAINAADEAITVATLMPFAMVDAGDMVATVKIIPFAVGRESLLRSMAGTAASVGLLPFRPMRVGVISTILPGLKQSVVNKTLDILAGRLAPADAPIVREIRVPHDAEELATEIGETDNVDIIVIFGASAITDRRDVVPVAVELAGGKVEHLGMPVDPGNLLLLGHVLRGGVKTPVIGAPGCARSPKENGFDFVLRRLLVGLPVTGADLRGMGAGGLLNEIVSRPQLRQSNDG